jgi:LPS-assembly lipoprotein
MAFQFSRIKAQQWLLILLAALTLSACGFHLRGPANLPFKTIYIDLPSNSALTVELKRYLHVSDAEVVNSAAEAETVLQVLANTRDQKILTLTTSGQVSQYSLFLNFTFQLKDNKGAIIIPPATIVLKRDVTYNSNQALAKEAEIALLYRDMQSDLVQQIIRRLAASRPNAGSALIGE